MLPLTDLKTATLYYQYVRFTRRHDWWRVINHVPCMKDCQWINRMISLYDITESAPENTVPKYRRNGARYGQTACVGGCVDRWSSSSVGTCFQCTNHIFFVSQEELSLINQQMWLLKISNFWAAEIYLIFEHTVWMFSCLGITESFHRGLDHWIIYFNTR